MGKGLIAVIVIVVLLVFVLVFFGQYVEREEHAGDQE